MHKFLHLFSCTAMLLLAFAFQVNAQGNFQFAEACYHDETVSERYTGATELTTCSGDGVSDRVRFTVSNLFMAFGYVVVDENDIIVHIGSSNFINFEMLPAGTLRVYAFSHFGFITGQVGDNINDAELSVPCFDLTDNYVTVNNAAPGDVAISTPSGETVFNTCPGDGNADEISFVSDGSLTNTAFIVTDENNVVIAINTTGTIDFDNASEGVCRVYAANYTGSLSVAVGDDLDVVSVSDACGGISGNYITVIREGIQGGTVATVDGATSVLTCPGDGADDIINVVSTGGTGSNTAYVITDENNIILDISESNELNFETAPAGICRVWSLSYEGEITAVAGDPASTDLTTGCFALSDNFVNVERTPAQGGSITTAQGTTEVAICPGDGRSDLVTFSANGNVGGAYTLVVTDTNNVILALPTNNEVDFENAGVGICRVWGLTYQGELVAEVGSNAATANLATSCADLSDNYVTIIRTRPAGGTISIDDGSTEVTLCPGDGVADQISFVNEGAEGSNFAYIVTNENNEILAALGDNRIDFDNAVLGVCRVWGLTYEGILLATAGDLASEARLADGCFSLSDNFVTVNRIEPDAATVMTDQGETDIITCPGDGLEDIVTFQTSADAGLDYAYIITDEDGVILAAPAGNTVDFESAEPGICHVYGIAYAGNLTIDVAANINTTTLATGCYALSENFIRINRSSSLGGTVSTEDGQTELFTCPGDGNPDVIAFDSVGSNLSNYTYLITDVNNVVVGLLSGDSFNFDLAGPGVCRLYGLAFEGQALVGPGDTLGRTQLATSCSAVSDNWVTVTRERPSGGSVSIEGGATDAFICPGDMIADELVFDSMGVSGGSYSYVITDTNNVILGIPSGDRVNFDEAGYGTCRLWGLSYQGELTAAVGDNAAEAVLATSCFSLSDNYVTVVRSNLIGGTITTNTNANLVYTCPGDGVDDLVTVVTTGNSNGSQVYVITDTNNSVLAVSTENVINAEEAGAGVCRIWSLVYTGELLVEAGDNASVDALSSGCFSLSEDFVTVNRTVPQAGTISANGENTIDVCSGDNTTDEIVFEIEGNSENSGYTYVITQQGFILTSQEENSFDFNNASAGTYEIYGLAYAGIPTVPVGAPLEGTELASSCYELTSNALTINVERVDGCELSVVGTDESVVYLCTSNPDDGLVEFTSCSSVTDSNYQYVITTVDDVIIFLMDEPSFDFGALPLPEVRVYAISYTGTLNNLIGATITTAELSTACYDITDNYITIVNGQPEAGVISLDPSTPDPYCIVNGNGDVNISTTSTSNVGYAIIVTTTDGIVVEIRQENPAYFDNLPEGDYLIFGASYTGNLTVEEGDDINLAVIADNCFELTQTPIEFYRGGEINGGTVSTQFGSDTLIACPGDGIADVLAVNATAVGVNYRYLVTDGFGDIIVPESFSNVFNFEDAPEGICRVYGYAYTGRITASFGDNVATAMLSDSCFALSENYITVIRQSAAGGSVATTDGATEVVVDLNSEETTVTMSSTGAANLIGFAYVITDENNFVIGYGDGPSFDFADASAGVCRVWGLSYQGELNLTPGDDATVDQLATGCYELSENFVEVTRTAEEGLDNRNYEALNTANLNLSAYPNPISEGQLQLIIESETELSDGQAYLRDQNGRIYAQQFVAGGTTRAQISFDASQLPTGLLLIQYVAGDELRVLRVMKQ